MGSYSIGVDLGGTNLRVAAIDSNGKILRRETATVSFDGGPRRVVNRIVATIERTRENSADHELCGVGIGVPGFIDMNAGLIVGSANLPGFQGFPVRDEIQQQLGTPIALENDANAAALGEMWMGAGRNVRDLILLTLGTGIGGGIVMNGKILHGAQGMAGEFGHMTVIPEGNPCGCGNRGCLEKHASASAIAAMASMMHFGHDVTAEQVYELARQGNERAKMIFESMGRALGIALANLIHIFNFPLYLISGGPLPAWNYFAPAMLAEVNSRSFVFSRTGTRIEKALLGSDAGLYGAAYLPFQGEAAYRVPIWS